MTSRTVTIREGAVNEQGDFTMPTDTRCPVLQARSYGVLVTYDSIPLWFSYESIKTTSEDETAR